MNNKQRVMLFAVIGIVVFTLIGCDGGERQDTIPVLKGHLDMTIRDASSAQFKNVEYLQTEDEDLWRGLINAKNLFGAYIGFDLFTFSINRKTKESKFELLSGNNPFEMVRVGKIFNSVSKGEKEGKIRKVKE